MKKSGKFLLVFLTALSMLCGVLGLVGCDQTKPVASSEGLKYRLLDDGTYHVSGLGSCKDTDIVIPATYIGKAVTGIAFKAFDGCSNIKSVSTGDGVTTINAFAFYGCSNLTSVILGNNVTKISHIAAFGCNKLSFNEYDECKYLGTENNPYFALIDTKESGYTSYTIHKDTNIIADNAFDTTNRLVSIVIPDSVTRIGARAFAGCKTLTSVVIGDSVTAIGERAFGDCTSLTSVYYKGTASDWNNVTISLNNPYFTSATRYYYSEEAPIEAGDWWHYNEQGEVVVW